MTLLSVTDLRVEVSSDLGVVRALDGVSFEVKRGECLAVVGESGSGKSMTALAIMGLLPVGGRVTKGSIVLEGRELTRLRERELCKVRGAEIGIVFQDPLTALSPVHSVGWQVLEAVMLGRGYKRAAAKLEALALLTRVGLPEARERFDDLPHTLSGGMRQRVMIAIALGGAPKVLVLDEPTTALDLLAAREVEQLILELARERSLGVVLISHDLSQVGAVADRIAVLYAGQIVEEGTAARVLREPAHPYTRGLIASIPPLRKQRRRRSATNERLPVLAPRQLEPRTIGVGCRFAPRCPAVFDRCRVNEPPLAMMSDGERARCWLYDGGSEATP
ncbi:MAG: ABC transporter ATP-binding protein [Myxococcales bacterium]|nr:ABC transporter ATP-binding protein [Myxococcales bacterium]